MQVHQIIAAKYTAPAPLTDRQIRTKRRHTEDRATVMVADLISADTRRYVLVIDASDGADAAKIQTQIEATSVVDSVLHLIPVTASADLEADERQFGRVEVDKVTKEA